MKFTVKLIERDMHDAMKLHLLKNRSTWRWGTGLVTILILGSTVCLYSGLTYGRWPKDLIVVVAILLLFPVFFFRAMRSQVAKVFHQQNDLQHPYTIEFSEEGYTSEAVNGITRMQWPNVRGWRANEKVLLLYQSDMLFNPLPLGSMNAQEKQLLLQFLERKLGAQKR